MSESANLQPDPSANEDPSTEAERRAVEDRDANPYPKPVRPTAASNDAKPSSYTALALPESSLSDMPLTNSALYEALGLSEEDAARIIGQESDEPAQPEPIEPVEPVEPIEPVESVESTELPEQTEPQPVERVEPPHPFDIAPVSQDLTTGDGETGDDEADLADVAEPTPALTKDQWKQPPLQSQVTTMTGPADSLTTGTDTQIRATSAVATTSTVAAATASTAAGASSADNRAPIWSEDWDAWIYWDTTLHGWFRHDEASGNWVPMDE